MGMEMIYLKIKAPVLLRALDDLSKYRELNQSESVALERAIRPRRRNPPFLTDEQRDIVARQRAEGLTMTEIADVMGVNYNWLLRAAKRRG